MARIKRASHMLACVDWWGFGSGGRADLWDWHSSWTPQCHLPTYPSRPCNWIKSIRNIVWVLSSCCGRCFPLLFPCEYAAGFSQFLVRIEAQRWESSVGRWKAREESHCIFTMEVIFIFLFWLQLTVQI